MVSTSEGKFIQFHLKPENGWDGHRSDIANAGSRTIPGQQLGRKEPTTETEVSCFVLGLILPSGMYRWDSRSVDELNGWTENQ